MSSLIDEISTEASEHEDISTKILECLPPRSKKRAVRRLKLSTNSPTISPVKRDLHLYRVNVKSLDILTPRSSMSVFRLILVESGAV